jgi:hypothetical protein
MLGGQAVYGRRTSKTPRRDNGVTDGTAQEFMFVARMSGDIKCQLHHQPIALAATLRARLKSFHLAGEMH